MSHFQPYGRVSARDRERRRNGWDVRLGVLMLFPIVCLVVVLYEFSYLQQFAPAKAAQEMAMQEPPGPSGGATLTRLAAAADQAKLAVTAKPKAAGRLRGDLPVALPKSTAPTTPPSIVAGRKTMILIANYRDSKRCSETLKSIFDNAAFPDLIRISIFDQIYANDGEKPCIDIFCQLVGEHACRRKQVVSDQIDAVNATGPTMARYHTENAIKDEDFCMAIDSHLLFVPKWDELVISQWEATENPYAIITVYPKSTDHFFNKDTEHLVQLMCNSRIETEDADAMIQYSAPIWIEKKDTPKPRLMSQLAGGFNFGNCRQAKHVRNDPYTPYLFHGEEYSRAARLWTRGYDFYVPTEDVVFHWYEKRKVVWERDWGTRYFVQQVSKRRIRTCLGLPVTAEDFDRTDIEKFQLGTRRTFEQWKNFTKIDPLAKFISATAEQFNNCDELEYVPYEGDAED